MTLRYPEFAEKVSFHKFYKQPRKSIVLFAQFSYTETTYTELYITFIVSSVLYKWHKLSVLLCILELRVTTYISTNIVTKFTI